MRQLIEDLISAMEYHVEQTRPIHSTTVALQAAREVLKSLPVPVQEPVAWTEREIELIDGMIQVQLDHARRCDGIANRMMAEKQKGWDMERVALLQKLKERNT